MIALHGSIRDAIVKWSSSFEEHRKSFAEWKHRVIYISLERVHSILEQLDYFY